MKLSVFRIALATVLFSVVMVSAKSKQEEKQIEDAAQTAKLETARISAEQAERDLAEKKKERLTLENEIQAKSDGSTVNK